mgnify:FL=1
MQLLRWKTQWIPLQIYVLIVGLKVKELLTVFLRIDTRLHQESTEKEWNTIINANRIMSVSLCKWNDTVPIWNRDFRGI